MSSDTGHRILHARGHLVAGLALCALIAAARAGAAETAACPSPEVVRAAANAAREAVVVDGPDAAARIEAASSLVAVLPDAAPDRLAIELHLLRTRMLAFERAKSPGPVDAAAPSEASAAAREPTLEPAFARLAEAARRRGEPGIRAFALVYGAELARARGDHGRADVLLDEARLVPESDATWEAQVAAEVLRARDRSEDEAIRSLSRARRILARVRPRLEQTDFLARARLVHERLAGLLLARSGRVPASATATEADAVERDLREALGILEELKLAELRAYFGDACLADLATTTPERMPGTVLLYPVVLEDRVELIVGASGRLARRVAPITPEALALEIARLRGGLQDPTSPRHRAAAARLHAALIAPIAGVREALGAGREAGEAETLVVVPSGGLRSIPFAALLDEQTGRYLIEDVAVVTLPSLQLLPAATLDGRRTRLLAAGLTEAVEDFSPLPFAARELDAAASRFPSMRRVDAAFTKSAFAAALESEPFDVVHVASHGRFDARASESFVLAHDGRIGFAELGEWIGQTRPRTGRPLELLVLSACETALGDERAALGLAGVAVQAGARSAVASLWKVHDEATMELFATQG